MRTLRAAGPLFLLLGLFGAACGTASVPIETPEERERGIPIGRAEHQRIGELTWRVGAVEREGEHGLRVDFYLTNGTSRSLEQGLLRIILYGPDGQQLSGRLPFVGISSGRSRLLSARFAAVPFRVADLGIEVIFVVP